MIRKWNNQNVSYVKYFGVVSKRRIILVISIISLGMKVNHQKKEI